MAPAAPTPTLEPPEPPRPPPSSPLPAPPRLAGCLLRPQPIGVRHSRAATLPRPPLTQNWTGGLGRGCSARRCLRLRPPVPPPREAGLNHWGRCGRGHSRKGRKEPLEIPGESELNRGWSPALVTAVTTFEAEWLEALFLPAPHCGLCVHHHPYFSEEETELVSPSAWLEILFEKQLSLSFFFQTFAKVDAKV